MPSAASRTLLRAAASRRSPEFLLPVSLEPCAWTYIEMTVGHSVRRKVREFCYEMETGV